LPMPGISAHGYYLTNVVKHFRWKPQGGRRLHQSPATSHVRACLPWFEAELELVRPDVIVCLGAVAFPGPAGQVVPCEQ
jgi:DNA polymerase